ncbi:MAG TPA: hypothetical protein PKI62_01965 [bacterium]|mgnify:CR=1 FL=1|nr:hypothetical protein [bacterium]
MKQNRHPKLWLVAGVLALLSTSLWIPQAPWIEDALTGLPAPGYTLHMPLLHLLFAPVLGPLFFFSRADAPLTLILWLLLWLCLALLAAHMVKARCSGLPPGGAILQGLAKGIYWLPVAFILVVAVLLIFLFSPFPGATIVPAAEEVVLVDFHSHSYHSHDGLLSPLRQLRWHKRNGFDAFFLTEHNTHRMTLELVAAQRAGQLESEPLLLAGEEYSGSNHLLLLGLTRDFTSKDYPDAAAIDSAHAQGGVALVAHWFAPQRNTRPLAEYAAMGVDGFEIANQAEGIFYPERYTRPLREAAAAKGLLLTGASDYHGYGPACLAWNALHLPGWRRLDPEARSRAILDLLRSRDQSRLQVLLYRDRRPIAPGLTWVAPFITLLDYFRSISAAEALSWLVWMALLALWGRFAPSIPERLRIPLSIQEEMAVAGAAAAAVTLLFGLWMLGQVPFLSGENRIFLKDGLWLSGTGILLFLYCIYLLKKLKKIQIF